MNLWQKLQQTASALRVMMPAINGSATRAQEISPRGEVLWHIQREHSFYSSCFFLTDNPQSISSFLCLFSLYPIAWANLPIYLSKCERRQCFITVVPSREIQVLMDALNDPFSTRGSSNFLNVSSHTAYFILCSAVCLSHKLNVLNLTQSQFFHYDTLSHETN